MAVIEDRGKIRQTGYEKRKEKSCAQHEVFVIVTAKTVQHHSPDKRENLCDLERPLAGLQVNVAVPLVTLQQQVLSGVF